MSSPSTDPMDRLPTGLKLFIRNLQSLTPTKLDDSNYPSWLATIRANLMAHRLLSYVDGTGPAPPSVILDGKATASGKEDPPIMKDNPAYETWMVVDAQIRACLLAIVSPTVQTHIHALPTSATIWTHLEQRYNSLSRTHIFKLKERLHNLQKGSDSMQTYLDNVLNIVSSLTLAHENISDQDVILCILCGLPTDYSSLKQNIRTNIGNVNLNQVSAWLLSEELNVNLKKQLQIIGSASSSPSEIHNALFTYSGQGNFRGRGRGGYCGRGSSRGGGTYGGRGSRPPSHQRDDHRGRGGPRLGPVTCQLCGKPGHAVWDSWHRFDESYYGPSQAYYTTQSTDTNSNWHLDTWANAHVTSDLSRLQSSSPYQGTNSKTTAGVTVLKETSPKKLWETLKSKFASKTLTNRLMMRMDLYSLKMEEGGSVISHINKFNEQVSRLLNAGETIKDEEQGLLLLASLPKSFKPFVQSMIAGRTTLRLDEVTTALKESQRMMGGEESSGDSHLLAAVSVEKERKKKSDQLWRRSHLRDMSTVRCYYYEKLGHTKNGCPELKEDLQILKEKKGKSEEASSANVITYEDDLF
ncbi:unnamed protein product [Cuscuta campestris]|uniref:Retrotransposon Copia-like N-terminal domain-containing protein n=1 Tax=Cuscuta campestris TaxID=132261 RepID=A0A484KAN4_9ASTE|nr:unnamed protein product [Cuscuta campestris]